MTHVEPEALGRLLRRMRCARGLTLREVERTAGVSATHLSEIERGKSSPTVGTLEKLASALGVEASRLLASDAPDRVKVTLAGEGRVLRVDAGALALRVLSSAAPDCEMSVLEMRIAPGGDVEPRSQNGPGEELVVVFEGRLHVHAARETCTLEPGDAAHVETRAGFRVENAGEVEAHALWVTTPRYAL